MSESLQAATVLDSELIQTLPASQLRFSVKRAYVHTFSATIVVRFLGIASGILAARLLGPGGRGELGVICFLPLLVSAIGEFELPRAIAFACTKNGSTEPKKIISAAFWLALTLGIVEAGILGLSLVWLLPADKRYLLHDCIWFLTYLPALYVLMFLTGADQGRGRFGRMSVIQILQALIYVIGILLAWSFHFTTALSFAFAMLAGVWIPAVVRVGMEFRFIFSGRPSRQVLSFLLKKGLVFYVPAVASLTLWRADTFLLLRLIPTVGIGLYTVAQAVATGQMGAISPFISIGFTAVASQSDPARAASELAKHFRLAQIAATVAALCTMAVVPKVIQYAFGSQFSAAVPVTYFLIIGSSFWAIGQVLDQGIRALGHASLAALSNVVGLLFLVTAGSFACLRWGVIGLSACAAMAQFINVLILARVFRTKVDGHHERLFAFTRSTLWSDVGPVVIRLLKMKPTRESRG